MTTKQAMQIIAKHTGGADAWDSEALRYVAERAIAGLPIAKHAAGSRQCDVLGLQQAIAEIAA